MTKLVITMQLGDNLRGTCYCGCHALRMMLNPTGHSWPSPRMWLPWRDSGCRSVGRGGLEQGQGGPEPVGGLSSQPLAQPCHGHGPISQGITNPTDPDSSPAKELPVERLPANHWGCLAEVRAQKWTFLDGGCQGHSQRRRHWASHFCDICIWNISSWLCSLWSFSCPSGICFLAPGFEGETAVEQVSKTPSILHTSLWNQAGSTQEHRDDLMWVQLPTERLAFVFCFVFFSFLRATPEA